MYRIIVFCTLSLFASDPELRRDPHKTLGPQECGECHKSELAAWKETTHSKTFFELTRREEAREIAKNMGIRRMKRDSDCMNCHFTNQVDEDTIKPTAGISCESCHGEATDWVNIHSDYGGKDVKKEQETEAHQKERISKSLAMGMIRPESLYAVAENCFQCHTVPNEKLVNVGKHKAGSDFELVAWSQGEVRHNFMSSPDGKSNIQRGPQYLRMMYVMGRALDLEYSLRATALSTEKAEFAVANAKRVQNAIAQLKKIQDTKALEAVQKMIEIGSGAKLKLNNAAELNGAADQVKKIAQNMQSDLESQDLSAIDVLLPKANDYKGNALN